MAAAADRSIVLGPGCAPLPESLLLAHAKGQVLFIAGAGVSLPSGLPTFRMLVQDVYRIVDGATHAVIGSIPLNETPEPVASRALTPRQRAEVQRFLREEHDVVLGMLERRLEGDLKARSIVRQAVIERLRENDPKPAEIHRSLMRLSDRGGATAIITTNFDRLLEEATPQGTRVQTYALGDIPRPTLRPEFNGVFHLHGVLPATSQRASDLILTDQDLGEFYLRRRIVPDFIYDAARLFHLVLVGYSANDPPMRYLLNAVAADDARFNDNKKRFTFFGGPQPADPVDMEDWRGRGITPIAYDDANRHDQLRRTLSRWAKLSPVNGDRRVLDQTLRGIVRLPRSKSESEADLFDHIIRRSALNERIRIARLVSDSGASLDWLNAISDVSEEADGELP
jgi:NAD-dependent SIR2 family protein deacetylase